MIYPFPLFAAFTAYTPVIPKFYWDVYSSEERIKRLCLEYDRITHYLNEMVDTYNAQLEEMREIINEQNNKLAEYDAAIIDLQDMISEVGDKQLMYDPTQGKYVSSKEATRNIYRELAVYGARVAQTDTLTVEQMADHRTDEISAVGNLTIYNDDVPRVTDKATGLPYTD